jgi:hypothetical protein
MREAIGRSWARGRPRPRSFEIFRPATCLQHVSNLYLGLGEGRRAWKVEAITFLWRKKIVGMIDNDRIEAWKI